MQKILLPAGVPPQAMGQTMASYALVVQAQQAIANGDMDKAYDLAKDLESMQPNLEKEHQYLNQLANQSRATKQLAPVNIGAEAQKIKREQEDQVMAQAKSISPDDPVKALGIFGLMNSDPPSARIGREEKSKNLSRGLSSLKEFLNSIGDMGNRVFAPTPKRPEELQEEAQAMAQDESEANAVPITRPQTQIFGERVKEMGEDMEIKDSEITKDSAVSIFKIITIRYFKTFLPKLPISK